MAEFENEVEVEEISDTDTEVEETNDDSPTYDDYVKLKNRLEKAEKTLVEYKKKAKTTTSTWDALTKQDLDVIRFIDKNPGYEWKETEIKSLLKKGLSMEQVKKLVEPDKTEENREKTKSASITTWESWWDKTTYSMSELENMSQAEYEKVMDLVDKKKVVIK